MNENILVVANPPTNLSEVVRLLRAAGYRVQSVVDAAAALEQAAQQMPDLMVIDPSTGADEGRETCRRLKADPLTADVPTLLVVAAHAPDERAHLFAAGNADYVTLLIEASELLARVRMQLALRRLQRELAAEVALKQRLVRFAGHDLRNPVCLILIAADLARGVSGLPAAARERLDSIAVSAEQIRRIIDTFLCLRGPGPGGARVDLGALADTVVRQHAPAAEAKRIALACEVSDGLPWVACDATLAYQALANLMSNALKFTPAGGVVAVRVHADDGCVRIDVCDSGPGVPARERGLLFSENTRLSPRPTAGEESHGFGLAIVKQLIESQGGAVGAEFPAAGGSTFWCALPVAAGA